MVESRPSRRKTTAGSHSACSGTQPRPAPRAWTFKCFVGSSRLADSRAWARSARRVSKPPKGAARLFPGQILKRPCSFLPTQTREGLCVVYQTESKMQGWRAVAVFADGTECLIYLARSTTQVRAGYAAAYGEILDAEEQ